MNKHHMRSARSRGGAIGAGLLGLLAREVAAEEPKPPRLPLPIVSPQDYTLTCVGSTQTVFLPALTAVPHSGFMTRSSRYSACLSLTGQGVSSAQVSVGVVAFTHYVCADALDSSTERVTVTWSSGETSVLSLQPAEVSEDATTTTVSYLGEVVSGRFQGQSAVSSFTFLNTDFTSRCQSAAGLTQTNALSLLVLTQSR